MQNMTLHQICFIVVLSLSRQMDGLSLIPGNLHYKKPLGLSTTYSNIAKYSRGNVQMTMSEAMRSISIPLRSFYTPLRSWSSAINSFFAPVILSISASNLLQSTTGLVTGLVKRVPPPALTFGGAIICLIAIIVTFRSAVATRIARAVGGMEGGWTKRGYGGGFSRTWEVWSFAFSFIFKYVSLSPQFINAAYTRLIITLLLLFKLFKHFLLDESGETQERRSSRLFGS